MFTTCSSRFISYKRIESSKTRIENRLESLIDYNEVINVNIKMESQLPTQLWFFLIKNSRISEGI